MTGTTVTASDGTAGDKFGISVVTDGSDLLVGAHLKDGSAGVSSGAVYVFELSGGTWSPAGALEPGDGQPNDHFGNALSLQGSVLAVGADQRNTQTGAVYLFSKEGGTWTESAVLTAGDGVPGDAFGSSVALSSAGVLAVGAPNRQRQKGIVYLFAQAGSSTSFNAAGTLVADDGVAFDLFGAALAISSDLLFVGAPLASDAREVRTGAVYQFSLVNGVWTQANVLFVSGSPCTASPLVFQFKA